MARARPDGDCVRVSTGSDYVKVVDEVGEWTAAHRCVWAHHNGPIPAGMYICHHCDHRWCIAIEHLFLCTAADNTADMTAKGRDRGRFRRSQGRFTEEEITAIRTDPRPARTIAPEYGVHHVTIHRIKTGELYLGSTS